VSNNVLVGRLSATTDFGAIADNVWIDLIVALGNELAKTCDGLGMDALQVIEAANTMPKGSHDVNILMLRLHRVALGLRAAAPRRFGSSTWPQSSASQTISKIRSECSTSTYRHPQRPRTVALRLG
jgi:hypothetical protein